MKSSRCQAAHSVTHSLTRLVARSPKHSFTKLYDLFTPFSDANAFYFSLCSYQDILHIPTSFQQFSTSLGPIVDGHVIPNQPYKVMGHYTEHFSRFVKQLLSQFPSHSQAHCPAFDICFRSAPPPPLTDLPSTHTVAQDYLFIVRYLIRCLAFGIWHSGPSGEIKSLVKSKYAFCGLSGYWHCQVNGTPCATCWTQTAA